MEQTLSPFKAGDRIVYRDDEAPFAEHAATILPKREGQPEDWYDVQPDDIADDTPSIDASLILRKIPMGHTVFTSAICACAHTRLWHSVSEQCQHPGCRCKLFAPIMCPECNEAMGHKDGCAQGPKGGNA